VFLPSTVPCWVGCVPYVFPLVLALGVQGRAYVN
jgi:hypothetical protein